jgi:hypothetical protein
VTVNTCAENVSINVDKGAMDQPEQKMAKQWVSQTVGAVSQLKLKNFIACA